MQGAYALVRGGSSTPNRRRRGDVRGPIFSPSPTPSPSDTEEPSGRKAGSGRAIRATSVPHHLRPHGEKYGACAYSVRTRYLCPTSALIFSPSPTPSPSDTELLQLLSGSGRKAGSGRAIRATSVPHHVRPHGEKYGRIWDLANSS